MAKGDDSRVRNQIDANNQTMQGYMNPYMNTALGAYGSTTNGQIGDYNDIMNRYRQIAEGGGAGGGNRGWSAPKDPFKSYAGYEEFSRTGGYSPEDIANMRLRASSQVRSNYANAEREMSRQRALQGGYSPNFMAASAKMAREQSQQNADTIQGTNADLAQMVNEGRRFGLQGMTPIESARYQMAARAAASGASAANANTANQMAALRGMASLYGTTPGQAQLFGNQALQGMNVYGDYGNNSVRNQIAGSQIPGQWDTWMSRIGDIGDIAGGVLYPW
jgi:hypothetical protein